MDFACTGKFVPSFGRPSRTGRSVGNRCRSSCTFLANKSSEPRRGPERHGRTKVPKDSTSSKTIIPSHHCGAFAVKPTMLAKLLTVNGFESKQRIPFERINTHYLPARVYGRVLERCVCSEVPNERNYPTFILKRH